MTNKKTILVTGATGGIGVPLCKYLSKKGYNLVLAARNNEKLLELQKQLTEYNNEVKTYCFDFSDTKTFEALGNTIEKLDGLVLMPPQPAPVKECLPDPEVWQDLFKNSFINPVFFIKKCIPFLEKSDRAKVAVVSGITSVQVLTNYPTGNSLRAALLAQIKLLSIIYGEKNIHFNTLSFGLVLTEKYKKFFQKQAEEANMDLEKFLQERQNGTNQIPLRKYATPDEAAYAIEGLLSNMTDHITGANLLCEGGLIKTY